MSSDVVVSVKNVAKDFVLPHEKTSSIKSGIVGILKKKDRTKETQHALKNISFNVKEGEFFGIVGRNGSGKSTLLKIISQIYQPTKGSVKVKGRLIPFIELGVGFNPELTGRENVYLNGALLGFSRKEIEERYEEIVQFAELEAFMDQKLKNYSSGMQVRLAFSVAIRADADVLILDEVLAVGDEAFQRKCNDYFFQAKKDGKTVILVTHSMESVRQFCDRAVLVDDGFVAAEGNPDVVANEYSKMFVENNAFEDSSDTDNRWGTGKVLVDGVVAECDDDNFKVKLTIVDQGVGVGEVKVALRIKDQNGYLVAGTNNLNVRDVKKITLTDNESSEIVFESSNVFGNQKYSIETLLVSPVNNEVFDSWEGAVHFRSSRPNAHYPIIIPARIKTKKKS